MYVVIDTEGSGLFNFKLPADAEGQPRLASLHLIYVTEHLVVEKSSSFFIKPDGWSMTPEATAINGLTDEFLHANGRPVKDALLEYTQAVTVEERVIVAFNAQHDCKTMRAELRRSGLDDLFAVTKNICVMRGCAGIVKKQNGKGGFPSLSDACIHFGIEQESEHTAIGDALAAYDVFKKLKEIGRCPEPAVHYAKNPPVKEVA